MNTATTTLTLTPGYFSSRNWFDWLFAAIVVAGGAYAFANYSQYMAVYELKDEDTYHRLMESTHMKQLRAEYDAHFGTVSERARFAYTQVFP